MNLNTYDFRKNQSYTTDRPATSATGGWLSQRQEPCIPYALSRCTSEINGAYLGANWSADGYDPHISQFVGEAFRGRRRQGAGDTSRARTQVHHGLIKKRPKGKTSPQLYEYKTGKLQELERQATAGLIDLYYGDESHICTEGYVPYGWQFRGEDVYIPSERGFRLNIFRLIDRHNRYEGFSTTENMTADKIADILDRLSMRIRKNTFVVLDNASVHRCSLMKELRPIWEKRGLFIFFLPPYSPHLNIAETLWRILKGKWLRPVDYFSTDSLLYAANSALAALGSGLNINFAHAT